MPAAKLNEQTLLRMLANGEEFALEEMYKQYWQPLFISAYNVTRDKEASNDILQDIFLQLWVRRQALQITGSIEAYLHTAVRYQCFKFIRKSTTVNRFFENLDVRLSTTAPDEPLLMKQLAEQVNSAVQTLPKQCMLIYKLSREQHLSNLQIAEELHISVKTVESQMTIALKRLRLFLNDAAFSTIIIAGIALCRV